jgi:hypothetical protein
LEGDVIVSDGGFAKGYVVGKRGGVGVSIFHAEAL